MAPPEVEARARELTDADWEQREDGLIECPECGSWQADMGHGVSCEAESEWSEDEPCGYAPMPTRAEETEVLLAYVRELAAGLTESQRDALQCSRSRHPRWLHPFRKECHALGLFMFDDSPKRTPLGRAVLRVLEEK